MNNIDGDLFNIEKAKGVKDHNQFMLRKESVQGGYTWTLLKREEVKGRFLFFSYLRKGHSKEQYQNVEASLKGLKEKLSEAGGDKRKHIDAYNTMVKVLANKKVQLPWWKRLFSSAKSKEELEKQRKKFIEKHQMSTPQEIERERAAIFEELPPDAAKKKDASGEGQVREGPGSVSKETPGPVPQPVASQEQGGGVQEPSQPPSGRGESSSGARAGAFKEPKEVQERDPALQLEEEASVLEQPGLQEEVPLIEPVVPGDRGVKPATVSEVVQEEEQFESGVMQDLDFLHDGANASEQQKERMAELYIQAFDETEKGSHQYQQIEKICQNERFRKNLGIAERLDAQGIRDFLRARSEASAEPQEKQEGVVQSSVVMSPEPQPEPVLSAQAQQVRLAERQLEEMSEQGEEEQQQSVTIPVESLEQSVQSEREQAGPEMQIDSEVEKRRLQQQEVEAASKRVEEIVGDYEKQQQGPSLERMGEEYVAGIRRREDEARAKEVASILQQFQEQTERYGALDTAQAKETQGKLQQGRPVPDIADLLKDEEVSSTKPDAGILPEVGDVAEASMKAIEKEKERLEKEAALQRKQEHEAALLGLPLNHPSEQVEQVTPKSEFQGPSIDDLVARLPAAGVVSGSVVVPPEKEPAPVQSAPQPQPSLPQEQVPKQVSVVAPSFDLQKVLMPTSLQLQGAQPEERVNPMQRFRALFYARSLSKTQRNELPFLYIEAFQKIEESPYFSTLHTFVDDQGRVIAAKLSGLKKEHKDAITDYAELMQAGKSQKFLDGIKLTESKQRDLDKILKPEFIESEANGYVVRRILVSTLCKLYIGKAERNDRELIITLIAKSKGGNQGLQNLIRAPESKSSNQVPHAAARFQALYSHFIQKRREQLFFLIGSIDNLASIEKLQIVRQEIDSLEKFGDSEGSAALIKEFKSRLNALFCAEKQDAIKAIQECGERVASLVEQYDKAKTNEERGALYEAIGKEDAIYANLSKVPQALMPYGVVTLPIPQALKDASVKRNNYEQVVLKEIGLEQVAIAMRSARGKLLEENAATAFLEKNKAFSLTALISLPTVTIPKEAGKPVTVNPPMAPEEIMDNIEKLIICLSGPNYKGEPAELTGKLRSIYTHLRSKGKGQDVDRFEAAFDTFAVRAKEKVDRQGFVNDLLQLKSYESFKEVGSTFAQLGKKLKLSEIEEAGKKLKEGADKLYRKEPRGDYDRSVAFIGSEEMREVFSSFAECFKHFIALPNRDLERNKDLFWKNKKVKDFFGIDSNDVASIRTRINGKFNEKLVSVFRDKIRGNMKNIPLGHPGREEALAMVQFINTTLKELNEHIQLD